ncbi:MAG: metallophosphoesterase family protein [Proteobacteria bacterium]|nr:metallophosphoesterase family protein [Pseudomonadota bacterium]
MKTIGIISDTHKLVRAEARERLRGVDLIIHAGDIGSLQVIEQLQEIALVKAIRGNIDKGPWADQFPQDEVIEIGAATLYVLHNLSDIAIDPMAAGFQAVISGHSHRPKIDRKDGVLYINPGSAGPRRFKLPIALAMLTIKRGKLTAAIEELSIAS